MTTPAALTPRQRQVLVLAANGHGDTSIGHAIGISRATVRRHLQGAFGVLGVRDRTQAVAVALRLGEVALGDVRVPVTSPLGPQQTREGPSVAA
ncbi:LuxR C-terminal-related transcriptional regulator [Streptomyces niveus]|uniref:LuxR C-terminal-related transcriptional regulator n=1 Tax=Streptomyces niveus TaxID=193462 RepID=UPI00386340B2